MMATEIILIVILVALAAAPAIATFGAYRWARETRALRAGLEATRLPASRQRVDFREIEDLPAPVQAYFRAALREGHPIVTGARIRHRGRFNIGETRDR